MDEYYPQPSLCFHCRNRHCHFENCPVPPEHDEIVTECPDFEYGETK